MAFRSAHPWHLWTLAVAMVLVSGCGLLPGKGTIRSGETSVRGQSEAVNTTLNTSTAGEKVALPQNSKITTTETAAQPATEKSPARPAQTVTVIEPGGPTEWVKTASTVQADTGKVDTSVSLHKIDVAERRWLLWAAIGCGILGIVLKSMLPAWPGISNGLLIASPAAFAAWKFAEVPAWLWFVVVVAVVLLALGYKRAEWDKNGDGIPDALQK